jgi:hypothetical protein
LRDLALSAARSDGRAERTRRRKGRRFIGRTI